MPRSDESPTSVGSIRSQDASVVSMQDAEASTSQGTPSPHHDVRELESTARSMRKRLLTMITEANSGHPGGSLSATEILTSLYLRVMRHDPRNPGWADRDRFVLSKGHCTPILYSVLAECGYFPLEELSTFRRINSRLQGHAHIMAPGVDASTGSLGQGLSFGIGAALAGRLDGREYRVYVLLGDGECDEGQVWEAAMAASHYRLSNLTAIVDRNRIQNDRFTSETMELEPLADKWRAFGWNTLEMDGHDVSQLLDTFQEAQREQARPSVIIAHTIKGKGVSFMENNPAFHGRAPTSDELTQALKELEE